MIKATDMIDGGMLGLFLLGIMSRRARSAEAAVAVSIGIVLIMWLSLSKLAMWPDAWESWANPLHNFMTIVLGTSSIVLLGALLGRLRQRDPGDNSL